MKQRKKSFGMRISAFVLSFAMVCTLLAGVNVVAFAADDLDDTVAVQKFYWNPALGGSGEHIYTVDEDEITYYSGLSDWNNEGDAWNAPLMSSTPVYRLCNYNTGEHIWVADKGYADLLVAQGWTIEQGIAFYSDDNKGVPVYRLWNGTDGVGCHHYTTDEGEIFAMVLAGWQLEDVQFYGVKEESSYVMTAEQTGANEITLTTVTGEFTGLEEFTVSHGDLVDELAGVEFDEEEGTAVITLADPIVEAVYTVSCEGFEPATFEGEEYAKEMTAIQSGAAEITVTSEVPFTGLEEFEVSHGLIEDAVEDVDFDDDMCTATITLDTNIKAAEYTVVCSDLEYDAATFTGEVAKVDSLIFTGDELIATDTTMKKGMVGFVVLDQFGDPIQDSSILDTSITSGVGTAKVANPPKYEDGKGAIEITASSGATLTLGTKVPVSVVYANSTKVAQTELTVSATSVVAGMTILDMIPNPEKEELIGARVTAARMHVTDITDSNYLIPFVAVDQYGNTLTADQLNKMLLVDKSLYVTPDYTTTSGIVKAGPGFAQGENGVVLLPVTGDGTSAGTGVLNFLSTGGFSTTKNVVVEATEVIDTLEITSDDLQVNKPVPFTLAAKNQYGEDVDLYSDDSEYTISATKTTINNDTLVIQNKNNAADKTTITAKRSAFVKDSLTGIWCLVAQPLETTETGADVLTVQTATLKSTIVNKRVNAAATVASVRGLAEGTNTVLGGTNTSVAIGQAKNFVFVDSYGEEITDLSEYNINYATAAPETLVANKYVYTVVNTSTASAAATQVTDAGTGSAIVIKDAATDDAKSDTYKVTLYGKDASSNKAVELSAKTFKVTRAGKVVSYAAGFVNPVLNTQEKTTLYTGVKTLATGGDLAKLVVYGVDKSGNKFPLATDKYTASLETTKVGEATLAFTGGAVVVADAGNATVDDPTVTANVDIYVEDSTTHVAKVVATASIECSDDAPVALLPVGVKIDANGTEMVDVLTGLSLTTGNWGVMSIPATDYGLNWNVAIITDGTTNYVIGFMDNYGMVSLDTVTLDGKAVSTNKAAPTALAAGEHTLNIASGTSSFKIPVKK